MFMIDLGASSYYSILGVPPDADAKEIAYRKNLKFRDLDRKLKNTRNPAEKEALEKQKLELNQIEGKLRNPRGRQEYDRQHVHLTFFVVRRVAAPVFDDARLRLEWIHGAVRDFLRAKGEQVEPVTDLDRSDFTDDYTRNDVLDRLLMSGEETWGAL